MNRHFEAPRGVKTSPLAQNIRVFVPGPEDHFALPGDITKAWAIALITRAMQLMGASALAVLVFRLIADQTERAAWHSTDRAPVNWRRQCDLARAAGISERHFRRIEARLVKMGVLARATADNGYRGRRAGQPWNSPVFCGLSLEPAIANYAGFAALCAEADALEGQRQEAIQYIRAARRRLGLRIEDIGDPETRAWAQGHFTELGLDFPPGSLRGGDLDDLLAHHAALLALEDLIRDALTPLPLPTSDENGESDEDAGTPGPAPQPGQDQDTGDDSGTTGAAEPTPTTAPCPSQQAVGDDLAQGERDDLATGIETGPVDNTPEDGAENTDESGAPDSGVRCHIQPQENLTESCNAQATSKTTPAKAGDLNPFTSHPNGRDDGSENKPAEPDHWINPAILQKLTPEALRDLASEDALLYLDAVADWRDCLPYLLRELGVNVSAWSAAVDVMGDEAAFLALLVIDRNRFHPVTPVRSPGGALRAFTDRARRGELNLTRAILGIWERDRQGKQPKAGPRPEWLV